MGLLKNIKNMVLGFQGKDLPKYGNVAKGSKLHNEYSINSTPFLTNKPQPSELDLDGKVPANNYRDTAPEGAKF